MPRDPAFLFYSSDFLTGIIDLSMEERGQYITLLCIQHQKGHLSQETIRFCVGNASVKVMSKFRQDEEGLYYNKRLDAEIDNRANFVESRRENGKKGGRPRKPLGLATDNLDEDENENRNIDVNDNNNLQENVETTSRTRAEILAERFDEFWAAYPSKVAKGKARESWNKIKPSAELHQKILVAIDAAKQSWKWQQENGRYIPNPTTWLNQGRWDDELPTDSGNVFFDMAKERGVKL